MRTRQFIKGALDVLKQTMQQVGKGLEETWKTHLWAWERYYAQPFEPSNTKKKGVRGTVSQCKRNRQKTALARYDQL